MSVLQSFFQLLKVIPPYGYIFIYPSSADRHLSCLHFFAKLWIIWTYVSSLLSGTSGSYNQSMLIDWPPNCFPKRLHYFSFPPAMNKSSCCSTSLSAYVVRELNFGYFDRCVVVYHFNLQFLNDIWCWVSFYIPTCHLYIFFGEVSVHVFCLFLNWVVHFLIVEF